MGVATRDGYSNFSFYTAFAPDVTSGTAGATNGRSIDLQGYDTATIVVIVQSACSGGAAAAADFLQLMLQHGLDDGSGAASAWSNVPHSQMIHSVIGVNGAYSVLSDGIFQSIASSTDALSTITYAVGYKGDAKHRHLRFKISNIDNMSAMWLGALAILGKNDTWPVNDVARTT